jgi:hypothetical protein
MGKLVELALRAARIGHLLQQAHQRHKRGQGNLRVGRRPMSQTSTASGIPSLTPRRNYPALWLSRLTPPKQKALNSPALARVVPYRTGHGCRQGSGWAIWPADAELPGYRNQSLCRVGSVHGVKSDSPGRNRQRCRYRRLLLL